jgi:hypothetical protein
MVFNISLANNGNSYINEDIPSQIDEWGGHIMTFQPNLPN